MRVVAGSLGVLFLLSSAGCTQNPYLLQSQNQSLQQEQLALQQRNLELESRAKTLDRDNQELQTLLAQSRQQGKLVEDQLAAVRDQLSSATAQLAQLREDKLNVERQVEALAASTRRRGNAVITANSSLQRTLPAVNIPGVEVRADGDVIRVELPAGQLFQSGGVVLQPSASSLLDNTAAELLKAYPDQIIGIEGHTDNDPSQSAAWASNQQLSVSRAMAVYQHLATRTRLQPGQLFVVGHGGNHPVVSNATPSGRERNSRVELVVYPEKIPGK